MDPHYCAHSSAPYVPVVRELTPGHSKLNSVALVRERIIPTERLPLVGEVVPTFADRGCHVVSATEKKYSYIRGPPGSGYEDYCLLGCDPM
jgi:hypothetical protein